MTGLLQYVVEATKELIARLQEALKNGETEIAGFIAAKQLPPLGEELLKNSGKIVPTTEEADKKAGKVNFKKNENPFLDKLFPLLDLLFGLNGEDPLSMRDAVDRLLSQEERSLPWEKKKGFYWSMDSLRKAGRGDKLIQKVLAGKIDPASLSKEYQEFFRRLKEKYPGKTFDELMEITHPGRGNRADSRREEAAKKQGPFR
ncbi:MAG: hypothetical protein Q7K28_03705 [Candidatus Wildermuthbacteria bacterium]|nr:hypothetical protein [Candidatus Wildermuthbacteria bacterium]